MSAAILPTEPVRMFLPLVSPCRFTGFPGLCLYVCQVHGLLATCPGSSMRALYP